jgi:putative ABC transport system permease protein
MKWLDAAHTRLRLLFGRKDAESRMNREFQLHIEMETERLMSAKDLAADEARRQARIAFGGVEMHKEALRDGRGLAWLGGLALDLKLATRLLARYPWLTVIGCVAMAFGIAAGVAGFELRTQLVNPSLPLDEGVQIVGLRNWDTSRNRVASTTASDLAAWRESLTRVRDVSAVSVFRRNLITDEGRSETVSVAAMTASAFRVTRVLPLLGRTLLEADAEPGAPLVAVIGYEVWARRFSRDPMVVGRIVRLGREQATVVGVMPEGFVFPSAQGLWVPLREVASSSAPADGSDLFVFGRLAGDASRAHAQAELSAVGDRSARDKPDTYAHLRPQVVPFAWLMLDPGGLQIGLSVANALLIMLLVVVSANVALLMFARAATRETEITVRSALGAGRARIVMQLFVEALVLAGLSVALGLVAARSTVGSLLAMFEANSGRPLPFWMGNTFTTTTVIYAGALTILSAVIIGVLPGLNVTGRGHQARLRQLTARGGGVRFGGVWGAVIAVQVAITLMFPAWAFFFHRIVVTGQTRDVGFAAREYLSALIELDRDLASGMPLDANEQAFRSRIRGTYAELERRLRSESAVAGLTFADRLPATSHPGWRIEIEGDAARGIAPPRLEVSSASVALDFFAVLGAPVIAGRPFTAADLASPSGVVIVNQSFANDMLGGQNPIGRRIRRARVDDTQTSGPWLEIVGVVRDLGMTGRDGRSAGLYLPVSADTVSPLRVAIRLRGEPESFAARFRTIASGIDPTLRLNELMPLDAVRASGWRESQYLSRSMAVVSAIALLLSLTAIYAVMAYTVSTRTREIGLRVALGADRRRVIAVILRRPLTHVGLGIVLGGILVAAAFLLILENMPTGIEAALIAVYCVLMMGVCLLACVVPARRALRLEPARALMVDV